MMHIVYVTSELATKNNSSGGLATYVANISRIFRSRGHEVTIILVTTKEQDLDFDDNINLINVYVEKKRWDELFTVANLLMDSNSTSVDIIDCKNILISVYKSKMVFETVKKIHEKHPIDIVQLTNLSIFSFQFDQTIPYVVRMSSFIHMCEWYDNQYIPSRIDWQKMSMIHRMNLDMLRNTKFVFAPSEYLQRIAKEKYDFNIDVLESPFALSYCDWDYQLYNKILRKTKYVLYFGRLEFSKGIHIIGEIAKDLLSKYIDVKLVLAGNDGTLVFEDDSNILASEYVKECAAEYKDRIIYIGRPVREMLYPIIQHAHVCIFPSRNENLSNACIEAMAMGKVVVATDGVSFEQLIDNKTSGFLCERENANSFMEGLDAALALSVEEKEKMGEKARKAVERLNDKEIYVKHLAYYKNVIEKWKE